MREAQTLSQLIRIVRGSWTLLALAIFFAIAVFFSVFSLHKGSNGVEIAALMFLGLAGGAVVRVFVRDSLVAVAFIVLLVAESLLCQLSAPWSALWPVLIPANAIGLMVGNVVRQGTLESSSRSVRDVWVINGDEEPRTESARALSLSALESWDSAKSGRFRVERSEGAFEAMGNRNTGFIVHCSAKSQQESEWQLLGSIEGREEAEVRLPSGPAYAPRGVVVDLETAKLALEGFYHYRGPDPKLKWTSGAQVLDLKFG